MIITLRAEPRAVEMGRTATVTATVRQDGKPVAGVELWPYVNGRRWGAQAATDGRGQAVFLLPLPWPGIAQVQVIRRPAGSTPGDFPVGQALPKDAVGSALLSLTVRRRAVTLTDDPAHRVGIAWEPWFTPLNARWQTEEAVPLLGNYPSDDADVIRQHALWLDDMGVDFLLVDWSNNLWGKQHWSEHPPGVDELVQATTTLLDTLAQMRREGLPTPQVTLLLGLVNGPPAAMSALNEEMQWVWDHYVQNPRYRGLWVEYEGKPLIVPLNTAGGAYLAHQPPVDQSHFTVRWMSTRLEATHHERDGFWSWMDGVVHPIPTYRNGQAEALTVTPAFFGDGGWTYPAARGRRGGATYLEEFQTALQIKPRFLLINQWNEFMGQAEGQGYGPTHDQFVDTYSVPLSDDIEPAAPTLPGYRGGAGWGFTYLNLTRALVQIYRGQDTQSTVLAVASPEPGHSVTGGSLPVEWTTVGRPAREFTLLLDGKAVLRHVRGSGATLPLAGLSPGGHTLTVRAEAAVTRYPLSPTQEDRPGEPLRPAAVAVTFTYHP